MLLGGGLPSRVCRAAKQDTLDLHVHRLPRRLVITAGHRREGPELDVVRLLGAARYSVNRASEVLARSAHRPSPAAQGPSPATRPPRRSPCPRCSAAASVSRWPSTFRNARGEFRLERCISILQLPQAVLSSRRPIEPAGIPRSWREFLDNDCLLWPIDGHWLVGLFVYTMAWRFPQLAVAIRPHSERTEGRDPQTEHPLPRQDSWLGLRPQGPTSRWSPKDGRPSRRNKTRRRRSCLDRIASSSLHFARKLEDPRSPSISKK